MNFGVLLLEAEWMEELTYIFFNEYKKMTTMYLWRIWHFFVSESDSSSPRFQLIWNPPPLTLSHTDPIPPPPFPCHHHQLLPPPILPFQKGKDRTKGGGGGETLIVPRKERKGEKGICLTFFSGGKSLSARKKTVTTWLTRGSRRRRCKISSPDSGKGFFISWPNLLGILWTKNNF